MSAANVTALVDFRAALMSKAACPTSGYVDKVNELAQLVPRARLEGAELPGVNAGRTLNDQFAKAVLAGCLDRDLLMAVIAIAGKSGDVLGFLRKVQDRSRANAEAIK